jgi:hypothetical protein
MATFGAARAAATNAADALRCAEALVDGVGRWAGARESPEMGIGIEVGPVVCGTIGEEGKLEYAVLGDPVNRAAKLQVHTKDAGVHALATHLALELARALGYGGVGFRTLVGKRRVAGVDAPLELVAFALAKKRRRGNPAAPLVAPQRRLHPGRRFAELGVLDQLAFTIGLPHIGAHLRTRLHAPGAVHFGVEADVFLVSLRQLGAGRLKLRAHLGARFLGRRGLVRRHVHLAVGDARMDLVRLQARLVVRKRRSGE